MDIIPWELWNIRIIFQGKGEFTLFHFEYSKNWSEFTFRMNLDLNVQLYKTDYSIYWI